MLFNEVNEHGVLADVLEKWEGESDELNKIHRNIHEYNLCKL